MHFYKSVENMVGSSKLCIWGRLCKSHCNHTCTPFPRFCIKCSLDSDDCIANNYISKLFPLVKIRLTSVILCPRLKVFPNALDTFLYSTSFLVSSKTISAYPSTITAMFQSAGSFGPVSVCKKVYQLSHSRLRSDLVLFSTEYKYQCG